MRRFALFSIAALVAAAIPVAATSGFMIDPKTKKPLVNSYSSTGGMAKSPIKKTVVPNPGNYSVGTIVVNTAERRLYLIQPDGSALKYGIGVGREGFQWGGTHSITMKREWPDWRPPEAMLKRRPDLPRFMPGGPQNPLGARAMYIGSTIFRIHGSNEPQTIGQAVSSGCFRMSNPDVVDLYDRVKIGTRVVILR
ncbi:L,D-transpeptidase [Terrihabitans soli]|uniref:L,D-transpeptidase n=1 Tax=Terrihabitans soli TaxID=708113 RepID=A0A6S6QTV4_9HYPH|nr:L,D-transpeptidase [Terrihabitans soli]BCJ90380.1 L,D-transpeptidase [Terrihabitans soli]